jgi:transcriptional accessory protein Tex/SPT6
MPFIPIEFVFSLSLSLSLSQSFTFYWDVSSNTTLLSKILLQVIKRLQDKPVLNFNNSDQFLLILKAEKERFIKMSIDVPPSALENEFKKTMELHFLSENTDPVASAWNEQRKLVRIFVDDQLFLFLFLFSLGFCCFLFCHLNLYFVSFDCMRFTRLLCFFLFKVLESALMDYLLPRFRYKMREKLRKEAEDFVTRECAFKLERALMAGPYEPPPDQSNQTSNQDCKFSLSQTLFFFLYLTFN